MLTMVTVFRDHDSISRAREHLTRDGIMLHDAEVLDSTHNAGGSTVESRLTGRKVPADDARAYHHALERGNALLVASIEEDDLERAERIMDDYGPVDVEEGLSAAAGQLRDVNTGHSTTSGIAATGTDRIRGEGEEVIPVVEEQLHVGKRTVQRGGVHVRTYVVETPVEEAVTLRDETVHIERRAIDPNRPADAAAFQERTIEVSETDEVPVVGKDVRVREELVIRKDVEERAQTVSDTVRRTEVEVEDERADSLRRTDRTTDRTDI